MSAEMMEDTTATGADEVAKDWGIYRINRHHEITPVPDVRVFDETNAMHVWNSARQEWAQVKQRAFAADHLRRGTIFALPKRLYPRYALLHAYNPEDNHPTPSQGHAP